MMLTTTTAIVMTNLIESLLILVKGMLGIFVFMALMYLLIWGLELLFAKKQEKP